MNLRHKILLLATIPLILAISAISVIVFQQANALTEAEIAFMEEKMLNAKKAELLNYLDLALTSIDHIYESASVDDSEAQEQVKEILNGLTYGTDGYFFVYTYQGTSVVHPKQSYRVGQNWLDLRDPNDNPVIQKLIEQAQAGGGFHRYLWEKPSEKKLADKISYATSLEKWNWMIGTGLYIDDVVTRIDALKSELQARIEKTFILISVITLLAVLAVFVSGLWINIHEHRIADSRQKSLTQRIVDVQEEERARVARELHDGISQIMIGVRYNLELALYQLETDSSDVQQTIEKGVRELDLAAREMRRISRDLRPAMLDDLGLATALESLVNDFSQRTSIKTEVKTVAFKNLLSKDVKTALYRVAQECLTNIERHAKAGKVSVRLEGTRSGVVLEISDDGCGFSGEKKRLAEEVCVGIGLRNMQERIEYFDGELGIKSTANGTRVHVHLPKKVLALKEDAKVAVA